MEICFNKRLGFKRELDVETKGIKIKKKIFFLVDGKIKSFDLNSKKERYVAEGEDSFGILDFDVSENQDFLAYSIKKQGFLGNSDIYIKDLRKDKVIRLTNQSNIASSNQSFFQTIVRLSMSNVSMMRVLKN